MLRVHWKGVAFSQVSILVEKLHVSGQICFRPSVGDSIKCGSESDGRGEDYDRVLIHSRMSTNQSDLENLLDAQEWAVHLRLRSAAISRVSAFRNVWHGQDDIHLAPHISQSESLVIKREVSLVTIFSQEALSGP